MKQTKATRPNPVDQYEALIRAAQEILGEEDVQKVRSLLYRRLTERPIDQQIQTILNRIQLSAGWARNHLLSIGSWNETVRKAVIDGLPLRDGAVVAQIQRQVKARQLRDQQRQTSGKSKLSNETVAKWEHHVLEPFYVKKSNVPKSNKFEAEVSAAIRQRTSEILAILKEDTIEQNRNGWWVPNRRARSFLLPEHDIWLYDALPQGEAQKEKLHPIVARAIVEKHSPVRGYVIDPMAGDGTIAHAAVELGRWVWPSDLHSQHPLIHKHDAMSLRMEPKPGLGKGDLVVVHPPSFSVWVHKQIGQHADLNTSLVQALSDDYFYFLSSVFDATFQLVRPGGNIAAVLRPSRMPPHEVDNLLSFTAVRKAIGKDKLAVAYHVAAARDGSEEWHILVFRKEL
jgi:hypothetical protein